MKQLKSLNWKVNWNNSQENLLINRDTFDNIIEFLKIFQNMFQNL